MTALVMTEDDFKSRVMDAARLHGWLCCHFRPARWVEDVPVVIAVNPYCTSSDARAIDFLGMVGVSPWGKVACYASFGVTVVLRAYPIRVAGNSGPLAGETSWEELGLPEERTTVTQKIRRVGQWDWELARAAVAANGGRPEVVIALAMADQRWPELAGITDLEIVDQETRQELLSWVDEVERYCDARVTSIGTGPDATMWLA